MREQKIGWMEETVHLRGVAAPCSQTLSDSPNWAGVGGRFVLYTIMQNILLVKVFLFFFFVHEQQIILNFSIYTAVQKLDGQSFLIEFLNNQLHHIIYWSITSVLR